MKFISTRGQAAELGFSDAVAMGLAPDGGLYLPETLPSFSAADLRRLEGLDYPSLAFEFLGRFATDIPAAELRELIDRSYRNFDHPEIAPLRRLDDRTWVLELFHGPTLAFKDFALQLLGNLYERQCRLSGQGINALGATSGDTGAAAIHGLLGKPRVGIFILYPDGRVSPLQERQMACTGADNVFALAVDGTFDDAQAAIKAVFNDLDFRQRHHLSAVNSINLARLLAQCVYYLSAWLRLPPGVRERIQFVVPTGNFGNVLAGWLLSQMGVPVGGFTVATNRNDILYRFFRSGDYSAGPVTPSLAPSMDIQAASNFERFQYYAKRIDAGKLFTATRADDGEIVSIIRAVHHRHQYVIDPHTACGFKDLDPARPSVVLATAHPAKFPEAIRAAIGQEITHPTLEALKAKPVVKHRMKAEAEAIKRFIAANTL